MKRIKQELLDEGFVVEVNTEIELPKLMGWLEYNTGWTWAISKPTNHPDFLSLYRGKYSDKVSISLLSEHKDNQLEFCTRSYYESQGNKVYDYDDIWEYCGGTVEISNLEFDAEDVFNSPSGFVTRGLNIYNEEQMKHFMLNLSEAPHLRGLNTKNIIFDEVSFGTEYESTFIGGNEMTKIEKRIEDLEGKVYDLGELINKLKEALKLDKKSEVLQGKLKKAKYDHERLNKLEKGYNALKLMDVADIFRNGDYVVVKDEYGCTASSKPDEHDSFNFCSGFAFCNMKLSLDNDYYVHEVNLALKDIEKRGL